MLRHEARSHSLGFGPTAPAEDGEVLKALQDLRSGDTLPGNSPPPGEAVGDSGSGDSGSGDSGSGPG